MKSNPDLDALVRLAESRGARVLRTVLPEAAPGLSMGRHEFTVPAWRPATVNELTKRGNHFSASALKKRDRFAVAAWSVDVPKAIYLRRVSVEVTMSGRMKPVDPDAIWKSLLDALTHAGLLVDDSARWVELGPFTQIKGPEKATRITLEDL